MSYDEDMRANAADIQLTIFCAKCGRGSTKLTSAMFSVRIESLQTEDVVAVEFTCGQCGYVHVLKYDAV